MNMEIVVYTDLLLDDLCALEVLGKWCTDNKVQAKIICFNTKELASSNYASSKVQTYSQARHYLYSWFKYRAIYNGDAHSYKWYRYGVVRCDARLILGPATLAASDLILEKPGYTRRVEGTSVIMGGHCKENGGIVIDNEYNSSRDLAAFQTVVNMELINSSCHADYNMRKDWLYVATRVECIEAFRLNLNATRNRDAYDGTAITGKLPYMGGNRPQFLDEYINKMLDFNEYVYCPDLMATYMFIAKNQHNLKM